MVWKIDGEEQNNKTKLKSILYFLIFVVPSIMLYSSEISPMGEIVARNM